MRWLRGMAWAWVFTCLLGLFIVATVFGYATKAWGET